MSPVIGKQIVQSMSKKLKSGSINLSQEEISFILDYLKSELGIL